MLTVIYELDNGYQLIPCSSFINDEMYRSLFYFLDIDIRYFNSQIKVLFSSQNRFSGSCT